MNKYQDDFFIKFATVKISTNGLNKDQATLLVL